jgi:hypothetical protein
MCIHKTRGYDLIGTVDNVTSSRDWNRGLYLRDPISLDENISRLGEYMVMLAMNEHSSSSEELLGFVEKSRADPHRRRHDVMHEPIVE